MNQYTIDNLRCRFLVAIKNEDAPQVLDILKTLYDANQMSLFREWRDEVTPFLDQSKRTYQDYAETEAYPIPQLA